MRCFQHLLSDYQTYREAFATSLFKDWQPAPVALVTLSRHRQELNATELQQALIALGSVQGWLLLTDQRIALNNQQVEQTDKLILSADLYKEGQSIRVRQLNNDNWLLLTSSIEAVESNQQGTHIATTIKHMAAEPQLGELEYQQLWCRDEQGRLHVEDAVFVGFTGAV
ncbi:hypothetical protein CBP31_13125 [Oceanisphaera profunda]|uniref:Chorismate lyase n=1 Tax=Oceanisphaera profunda TaxID=1416627 RepID=A0A1Y0D7D5_9GAMM|nr:hypothetical protein [Oceanisphaera profunda]ART83449.1 hypothetical protein CBP31_13125 [Oceanisphaera profunda]